MCRLAGPQFCSARAGHHCRIECVMTGCPPPFLPPPRARSTNTSVATTLAFLKTCPIHEGLGLPVVNPFEFVRHVSAQGVSGGVHVLTDALPAGTGTRDLPHLLEFDPNTPWMVRAQCGACGVGGLGGRSRHTRAPSRSHGTAPTNAAAGAGSSADAAEGGRR